MKFDKHGDCLISAVAGLFSNSRRCCDLEVTVGTTVFRCHKLVLSLKSTYFEQMLYSEPHHTAVQRITLDDIRPENFKNVLHYMYTGDIQLDSVIVTEIIHMARLFDICDLKQLCLQFAEDTLEIDNCLTYWKLAEEYRHYTLGCKCYELFAKVTVNGDNSVTLQDVTEGMLKIAIENDDLAVRNEVEICEMIMRWCDVNRNRVERLTPLEMLRCVRWSGIEYDYVRLRMNHNDVITKYEEYDEYLSKIISYKLRGNQFDGLLTFHRPSTGFEMCTVLLGINTSDDVTSDCFRVSLQRRQNVTYLTTVPTTVKRESAACSNNAAVYITGIGLNCQETWRWDSVGGWARCGDMVEGRRRHCATFVNNTSMYALGGFLDSSWMILSSVEHYNTVKNKWTTAGKLANPTQSAGCIVFKTSVYVFGGISQSHFTTQNESLDCIQVFDTITCQCSVLTERLPRPLRLLRAVLWNKSVILINDRSCLVFDLDKQTFQQQDQFAAGVIHFGLAIENETLFILGGGFCSGKRWTCRDEVKYIPVKYIINNEPEAYWIQHAKLSSPCLVQAYSTITLPVS